MFDSKVRRRREPHQRVICSATAPPSTPRDDDFNVAMTFGQLDKEPKAPGFDFVRIGRRTREHEPERLRRRQRLGHEPQQVDSWIDYANRLSRYASILQGGCERFAFCDKGGGAFVHLAIE